MQLAREARPCKKGTPATGAETYLLENPAHGKFVVVTWHPGKRSPQQPKRFNTNGSSKH